MVAKSDLQFAGEFIIDECTIITTSGKNFDLKQIIEEINIYEDIYSSTITGSITIKDTTNVVMNLPIIGEERLSLKILTPQSKPEPETTIDYTQSLLMIYKVNLQTQSGEGSQIIQLQFGAPEGLRNNTTKVSQSYSGQPAQIIEKILRDKTYLNSKKTFYYEPTANNVKIVFPNITPIKAIRHLTKISNSQVNNSSPSYLFYETTKGYHFRTFDSICREEPKFQFKETMGNQLNEQGVVDVQATLDTIVNYSIVASKDTVSNVQSGMISSKLINHDIFNKRLDLYKYDYLTNFDKDIHPDNGESTPIISQSIDVDTNKRLTENEDTKVFVSSTASGYSFSDGENYPYQSDNKNQTLQRRTSRKLQFDRGMILNVEINGQTFIQAGDKIDLQIGALSAVTDKKIDENVSGGYVVTHLRHTFTQSGQLKHKIIMRVAKDSKKGKPLPNSGVPFTYSDSNKSRTVNVSAGYSAGDDYVTAPTTTSSTSGSAPSSVPTTTVESNVQ